MHTDMRDDVRAYYAGFGEREWTRLTRPDDGAVEFAVTCHALETHLPAASTGAAEADVRPRVLDIGGGPGRYALWLAERGYRVTLADLSPELLEVARREVAGAPASALVEEIIEADACDLSRWHGDSFDAALCLGPFYHLTDPGERERAARELVRVLRPGGVAFVALMPRYAFLRRTLALSDERHRLRDAAWVARVLDDGVFVNDVPGRFTGGYGVRPQEVASFFARHGLAELALLAAEGIMGDVQGPLSELSESDTATYRAALDLAVHTAADPAILGMSSHLLYVGRKEDG